MSPIGETSNNLRLDKQPEVHLRRWWILGVMCLSLLLVVIAIRFSSTSRFSLSSKT